MTRKIGYARVSTDEQNLDMQINALHEDGCDYIYREHASGTVRDRKELNKALAQLKEGDTLVVWSLDRLGRDPNHISNIVYQLKNNNINIKSLNQHIDPETPEGRMIIGIHASLGEIEHNNIINRTKSGLEAARKRGVILGRPSKNMNDNDVLAAIHLLNTSGMSKRKIALQVKRGRTTLWRWEKKIQSQKEG
jgi:DNA invertase Pin-like site-specific DNA recombinase